MYFHGSMGDPLQKWEFPEQKSLFLNFKSVGQILFQKATKTFLKAIALSFGLIN